MIQELLFSLETPDESNSIHYHSLPQNQIQQYQSKQIELLLRQLNDAHILIAELTKRLRGNYASKESQEENHASKAQKHS